MINHNQNPFFAEFVTVSACLASLQKFLKGKSDAVRVAHLQAARALSSPSRCIQLSTNLDNDLFGCFLC